MKTVFTPFALMAVLAFSASETKASEFFVKIKRSGPHTVMVNDQYQANGTNTYRFFDLPAGNAWVRISDANTGALIFDGNLNLGIDQRMVAEMQPDGTMNIISSMQVTWSNWYTENMPAVVPVPVPVDNTPPPPPPAPVVCGADPEKFKEIVSAIKAQNVESYRLEKAKTIVKKNQLSSKQVAEICNLFGVESYKLDFAKFAYDYTVDKDNYFVVGKTFKVASYSRDLDRYIDGK